MKSKTQAKGFTIIEILLAIVILCILAALIALTANGVRAKDRNAERQSRIENIRTQLETYYATTNTYPTLSSLNDKVWRSTNLPKLAVDDLKDPKWDKETAGCTHEGQVILSSHPIRDCFSYQVTSSDGSACDNGQYPCVHYTLTASLEGGEKYTRSSLN